MPRRTVSSNCQVHLSHASPHAPSAQEHAKGKGLLHHAPNLSNPTASRHDLGGNRLACRVTLLTLEVIEVCGGLVHLQER